METNDGRAFEDGAAEIRTIQHLISALDAQDALIAEGDRSQGFVVPMSQLFTIKQIFQEILTYRSGLVRPFQPHGSPMGYVRRLKMPEQGFRPG